ncbi:hypothetical protein [Salinicoccus carnicancri]|uniref:hypothetical protein n=1 Tax=Salinicoccus carnicancri TaxID=558170 RepID=UPI0002D78D7A|nr:hypothetical protein [Salinicoccus carnicancri]
MNSAALFGSIELSLEHGYIEMSEINLSIACESEEVECEAWQSNEDFLVYSKDGE